MTRLASNVTSIRTVYVAGVPTANQRAPLREPCSSASETGAVPSCTVRAIFSGSHIYLTRSCMTCTYMQHSRNLVMVRRQDATTTTGGVPTPTASSPSFFLRIRENGCGSPLWHSRSAARASAPFPHRPTSRVRPLSSTTPHTPAALPVPPPVYQAQSSDISPGLWQSPLFPLFLPKVRTLPPSLLIRPHRILDEPLLACRVPPPPLLLPGRVPFPPSLPTHPRALAALSP